MARESGYWLPCDDRLPGSSGGGARAAHAEEYKVFDKLLAEPDGKAATAKRLAMIAEGLERYGDDKRRESLTYGIDLKRARIPAEDGVPFLLAWAGHSVEITKRTAWACQLRHKNPTASTAGFDRSGLPAKPLNQSRDVFATKSTKPDSRRKDLGVHINEGRSPSSVRGGLAVTRQDKV